MTEKGSINGRIAAANPPTILGPVDPLVGFDWKTTEPLKHRPFKPKYHLTMGKQPARHKHRTVTDRAMKLWRKQMPII